LSFLEEKGFFSPPIHLNRNQLFDVRRKKKYYYLTRSFIFWSIWSRQEAISEREWKILCTRYPILEIVKNLISEFRDLFNNRSRHALEIFLEKYKKSIFKPIRAFADSLIKDFIPVSNAVTSTYSNGFVEGNNNKLKMIKRLSYGRSSLKLLKAKLLLLSLFLPSRILAYEEEPF
jgi:transposase